MGIFNKADKASPPKEHASKRVFDLSLALLGLVLSSPLWLLASLAIYFENPGPVIFSQDRCGKKGVTFKVIKFRTMRHKKGNRHKVVVIENDPRVTKVGRILRATAMDELPSLLNVVKGDMSFVGPRAEPFKIGNEKIADIPGFDTRCRVKPGLTGIAQVYASKDIDLRTKFQYDSLYVERMSFWLDLKLIFLSFWITLKGGWEHRKRRG
jgi:lipopolysaccharide/colanic/teichoic acid biosynthesis glycosyltransferase